MLTNISTKNCPNLLIIIIMIDAISRHRTYLSPNSFHQLARSAAAALRFQVLLLGLLTLLFSCSSSVKTFMSILLLFNFSIYPTHWSLPKLINLTTSILPASYMCLLILPTLLTLNWTKILLIQPKNVKFPVIFWTYLTFK